MRLLLATILFGSTLLLFLCPPTQAAASHPTPPYTAYPVYPPYCSTPEQMHERGIPPLQTGGSYGASQLIHVTAIIRHGARTPWSGSLPCWNDFQSRPWDCKLKTSVSPQLSATWFNKHYDALQFPQYNLTNELQGTCELGQLIDTGVVQELVNGEHLRVAYFDDGTDNYHHDSRMQLNAGKKPWESLYYRADDEQRTLMSGRILLKGLFGNELTLPLNIPLHTADYHRDIVGENEDVCPRLTQMRELFYLTDEFKRFNESADAMSLRDFQRRELGTSEDMELDCFMTTICTDRPLPDPINDYTGEENDQSMFLRLVRFAVQQFTSFAVANDAEYSKLAIGPLWAEIMENIDRALGNAKNYPRLALFSGHDTTIIFLLASLSKAYDGSWPPYASKLLLEIHEIDLDGRKDANLYKSGHGFRLIYNGQVLTDRIEGCPKDADVCDVAILKSHLTFSFRDRDCSLLTIPTKATESGVAQVFHLFLSPSGFGVFVVIILSSMAAGCALMFLFLFKTQPQLIHRRSYGAACRENPEMT